MMVERFVFHENDKYMVLLYFIVYTYVDCIC